MLLPRLKNDTVSRFKLNELQRKMKTQVTYKVDTGVYKFEEIACPVCASAEKEGIGEKDRYGLFYKTNLCTSCGLVYTSPRMTQEAYNEFYNLEYRKLYVGKETATDAFYEDQKRKGEKIYHFLQEQKLISDSPLFVVEVGCGAGGILGFFREKGHTVKGIDLGEEYIAYGKDVHGLDLEAGALSQHKFDKKPDIIIYSHVLEHILDLNKELETIKEVISKDTLVYIEVPGIKEVHENYKSNILRYFQNAHTFHFSLETLTNLFAKNGFRLIKGNQFVQSVFIQSDAPTDFQNDYSKAKQYILDLENKRKFFPYAMIKIKNFIKGLQK